MKFTPLKAVDISNYNQVSVDLIYPENSNISKIKFFSKSGINKDTSIDTSEATDAGNGYKKVTITLGFSPSTTPLDDLTIGLIGVNSSFEGDVYLDNLILSQKDASGDFVKITTTPNENGTQAAVATTTKTLTMTDPDASDSAKALYAYLQGLTESDQVLFGHQNDVSRSVSGKELGDVKDVTGSVSGIFGIDSLSLFGSEAGGTDAKTALDNSIKYSKDAAEKGAIVTLSAHMPNFTNAKITKNEDGTYNFFNCDFNESKDTSGDSLKKILPGGEKNDVYTAYLDTIATYAKELQQDNIPVIFRPFHENTGSWFWWGSANTVESYKSLYAYTRDYLESKGVHNMLYVYSPNGPLETEEDYMKAYPGDAYVDILAFDYYNDFNTYPASADTSFFKNLDTTCSVVSSVAKKHGKLAAISETGTRVMKKDGSDNEGLLVKNNPVSEAKSGKNWYQEVSNIAKKNDMPYYLVWANFSDTNFYVPYKYNDTLGQEMINDFISYYNDKSSIFGNGTNFYDNISKFANAKTKDYTETSGYMVAPFDMDAILDTTTLKASVSNATKVSFVVKDTASNKSVTLEAAKNENGLYTAELTDAIMAEIGKTDVAQIQLVADGKTLSTIENLSLGKEKEKAPAGVLENFDYYVGSNGLLDVAYNGNSAAGCSSSFTLDKTYKSDGTYGAAFNYKLKTASSEVWTGLVNSKLSNTDFSAYNALKFWTKLDGEGQKVVVQIKAGGEEFEVYLTNLAKTTGEYELTVPFSAFKGKNRGTLDVEALKDVQAFGIWCNSNPAGGAVDVESTIYFDAFVGTNASESEMTKVDANGFVIADTNSGNNGGSTGGSTGGTITPGTTTPDKPSSDTKTETTTETKPDGSKVETTTTTKADGSVTKKSEITDASGNKVATVTVKTDAAGKTTATANVTTTSKTGVTGAKTTISADTVKKITDAAGTEEVVISQKVVDATGKTFYTVKADASDLTAGNKLSIVKYNEKTKKYTLVSKKEYKVSASGNVSVTIKNNGTYKLVDQKKADEITKSVLKTVKAKNTAKTVKKGKKTTMTLSSTLDKTNVSKITYTSSKSSVAKVDKKGKITAKKAGTATIKAKVTLKNGKTKTVTMKVTVK
uniref:glycosyl hydrolase n=1 Tax=Agathobacter sp. TaxID=2021311 RepID=UPI0040296519